MSHTQQHEISDKVQTLWSARNRAEAVGHETETEPSSETERVFCLEGNLGCAQTPKVPGLSSCLRLMGADNQESGIYSQERWGGCRWSSRFCRHPQTGPSGCSCAVRAMSVPPALLSAWQGVSGVWTEDGGGKGMEQSLDSVQSAEFPQPAGSGTFTEWWLGLCPFHQEDLSELGHMSCPLTAPAVSPRDVANLTN